jgi:hypothetical protein
VFNQNSPEVLKLIVRSIDKELTETTVSQIVVDYVFLLSLLSIM